MTDTPATDDDFDPAAYAWLEPALFNHSTEPAAELAARWFEAARAVEAATDNDPATVFSPGDPGFDADPAAAMAALTEVEAEMKDYFDANPKDYRR
jgi:uncharacterized surface protein with fasciclin (FAS1) repeats